MTVRRCDLFGWALALCCAVGCGAKTGLLVDDHDRRDAAPGDDADLHGDFPCNYSRVGELERLLPLVDTTTAPDLAWGGDRLGAAFTLAGPIPRVGACTTNADQSWECRQHDDPAALGPGGSKIAWDGENFGVCWSNRTALAIAQLQRYTASGEPLWRDPVAFSTTRGSCRELIWTGSGYLAAVSSTEGVENHATHVISLDRDGTVENSEVLRIPGYHGEDAPFALAVDGEIVAAAWVASGGLLVRSIRGMTESEIAFLVWPDREHLALALRGTEAGVVWVTEHEGTFRVFLMLVDLDTGGVSSPTEVGDGEGILLGVDVVAVHDGYVVAFSHVTSREQREVVVPTRAHEGPSVEVRGELVIHEASISPGPLLPLSSPSLTYNGLDVFIAVTLINEDWESNVFVQRLACHR